ncbi:MAG TPA: hypothetical protein VFW87_19355 [Pirellulales bacterium]|nr:hypothetical protein [Pirellulales bacterium]
MIFSAGRPGHSSDRVSLPSEPSALRRECRKFQRVDNLGQAELAGCVIDTDLFADQKCLALRDRFLCHDFLNPKAKIDNAEGIAKQRALQIGRPSRQPLPKGKEVLAVTPGVFVERRAQ